MQKHTVQHYVTAVLFYFIIVDNLLLKTYSKYAKEVGYMLRVSRRPRILKLFTYRQHFISVYTHVYDTCPFKVLTVH
jgi:hypothetical protein